MTTPPQAAGWRCASSLRPAFRLVSWFVFYLTLALSLRAQSATGTVAGRVFNPATGGYLERVQLTVEGTSLETFSDEDGNYRLQGVPAGTVKIRAFRTGLPPSVTTVMVTANMRSTWVRSGSRRRRLRAASRW